MEILLITPDNIGQCVAIFIASYNRLPWNYQWKEDAVVKYLNEYVSAPQFKGFMVYDDGQVLGALLGHTKTWWTNNQFMIDEIFIDPHKQRSGYGKLLLLQVELYAKEHDIELVTLMTNKFMPAIHFYHKNNFNKVDQYVFMFRQL